METSIGLVQVTLCDNVVELINDKAEYEGVTFDIALERIVYEWAMGEEMKPLSTKKEVNETNLQNTLDNMNKRLSCIEGQLEKWSNSNTP